MLLQPPGVVDQATWISTELATIVAWLGGDNLRQRRARWAALQERNEFLEREREERARKAVVDERLRIARELHDVVAHAMSVIAVQSGVGNHVIETQPAEAKKALAAIETTSRSVLIEMRRLLGILRQDGESDDDLVPAPGLRDVPALIRNVAEGGVTTGLRIKGAPREIPASVDLSAYRIVQEGLADALANAGAAHLPPSRGLGPSAHRASSYSSWSASRSPASACSWCEASAGRSDGLPSWPGYSPSRDRSLP